VNKNYKIFYNSSRKIINYISFADVYITSTQAKNWKFTLRTVRMNDCAIRLPSDDDKWLSFSNYSRKERVSFVVYVDLECTLEKTETEDPKISSYTH